MPDSRREPGDDDNGSPPVDPKAETRKVRRASMEMPLPSDGPPVPDRPRTSEPPQPAPLDMPEADQQRILELYEKLNRIDHYRLLGVAATDDAKAIKRAYYGLAKHYHPDRWFRKNLGALRPKVDAVFAALTAAQDTLSDAQKRAEYDGYLRAVLKTRLHRRQAEALEGERNWTAAAEIWSRIVEQLPTDAYVQHRYASSLLHARRDFVLASAAANRAIELDSTRAEYRVTAACLHLAEGRDRSALAQLVIACEIEPDRKDVLALQAAVAERVARAR